ncbi:MAG: hypothetical protein ACYS8S_08255 [Planctomycetota bacterium]
MHLIRVDTADLSGDVLNGRWIGIDAVAEENLQPYLPGVLGA